MKKKSKKKSLKKETVHKLTKRNIVIPAKAGIHSFSKILYVLDSASSAE